MKAKKAGAAAAVLTNSTGRAFAPTNRAAPKESRVTPDGQTLLFSSELSLTGYDNSGPCAPCRAAGSSTVIAPALAGLSGGFPACRVTPTPRKRRSVTRSWPAKAAAPTIPPRAERLLPRNLSEDGSRVFFDSPDALVAGVASNLTSVYEWEAPASQSELERAENSCTSSSLSFHASDEGCLFLISSGIDGAYFGDASANGGDVFFFTAQQLAPSDDDEVADVYDASVTAKAAAPPATPNATPNRNLSLSVAASANASPRRQVHPSNPRPRAPRSPAPGT